MWVGSACVVDINDLPFVTFVHARVRICMGFDSRTLVLPRRKAHLDVNPTVWSSSPGSFC